MSAFLRFADAVSEYTGRVTCWLTTLLVVVVCFDVATRYLLDFTLVAVQEIQWHLFAVIFLIGAAYTLRDDRHVRVDVLYANFSPRGKAWVNLLGTVLLLGPFCVIAMCGTRFSSAEKRITSARLCAAITPMLSDSVSIRPGPTTAVSTPSASSSLPGPAK